MTPAEVARYVRCFQKAATTRKVKSRLIRRTSRYSDNVAELIRSVLPKAYFKLILRRRRGYELEWEGTPEISRRLCPRLNQFPRFQALAAEAYRGQRTWVQEPYEDLLNEAVAIAPILQRFRRDEARRENGEAEAVAAAPEVEEDNENLEPEPEEEEMQAAPLTVTPVVPPQVLAEQMAAAARARAEAVPTNVEFQNDAQRRFAEMLARATGRGQR